MNDSTAAPLQQQQQQQQRSCLVHGLLPLSRFYKEDLSRNRHRCKRCVADQVARSRAHHPLRTLWRRFIQRARLRFGAEVVSLLDWHADGRPLLRRLTQALDYFELSRCMLTWPASSATLQLTQLALLPQRPPRRSQPSSGN